MGKRLGRYLGSPWALTGTALGVIAAVTAVKALWNLKPVLLPPDGNLDWLTLAVIPLMLTGVIYQLCARQRRRASATFALGLGVVFLMVVAFVFASGYHMAHRPWVWQESSVSLPESLGKVTIHSRPPYPPSWFPMQDNHPQWNLTLRTRDGQTSAFDLGQRAELTPSDLVLYLVRRGERRYLRLSDLWTKRDLDLRTGREVAVQKGSAQRLGSFDGSLTFIPWHDQPAASGGLFWPDAIAVDRAGVVYVVDAGTDHLVKYSPEGRYLAKWPVGEFHTIYDIATDERGHVWLTSWNSDLRKYSAEGRSEGSFTGFPDATGLGCGADGTVYVTQRGGVIKVVNPAGQITGTWRWRPDHSMGFCGAAGAPDGSVVAAHWGRNRICRFDARGRVVRSWRVGGGPVDAAVDEGGDVFVALWQGKTIKVARYDLSGRRLARWDTPAGGDQSARRLAARGGVVYVADREGHRILRYTDDGQRLPDFGQ